MPKVVLNNNNNKSKRKILISYFDNNNTVKSVNNKPLAECNQINTVQTHDEFWINKAKAVYFIEFSEKKKNWLSETQWKNTTQHNNKSCICWKYSKTTIIHKFNSWKNWKIQFCKRYHQAVKQQHQWMYR